MRSRHLLLLGGLLLVAFLGQWFCSKKSIERTRACSKAQLILSNQRQRCYQLQLVHKDFHDIESQELIEKIKDNHLKLQQFPVPLDQELWIKYEQSLQNFIDWHEKESSETTSPNRNLLASTTFHLSDLTDWVSSQNTAFQNKSQFTLNSIHYGTIMFFVMFTVFEFKSIKHQKELEEQANLGLMVAQISHEGRNALQQIQCTLDLLQYNKNLNEETIQDLYIGQNRLIRMFDDVRSYTSEIELDVQEFDIIELCKTVWEETQTLYKDKNMSLRMYGPNNVGYKGDPFWIERVFVNLFYNSIQSCENTFRHCRVTVRIRNLDADNLVISFWDNGEGIPEDISKKIFEPFYTTKTKGTGLGLSIIEKAIKSHGGKIKVDYVDSSRGSIVLTLPLNYKTEK